jgi:hypothetical protein
MATGWKPVECKSLAGSFPVPTVHKGCKLNKLLFKFLIRIFAKLLNDYAEK